MLTYGHSFIDHVKTESFKLLLFFLYHPRHELSENTKVWMWGYQFALFELKIDREIVSVCYVNDGAKL